MCAEEIRVIYYITNIELYLNLNYNFFIKKTLIKNNIYNINIYRSFQEVDVITINKFQT